MAGIRNDRFIQLGLLVLALRIFRWENTTAFEFFRFPFTEADAFKDRRLNHDDVAAVVSELVEVQTMSKPFGRYLKLPKFIVDSIHMQNRDPLDCLFGILDEFVKQVEPTPTWRVILEALRNPSIGFHHLAQEIERKHCPLTYQQNGIYLYAVYHWYEGFLCYRGTFASKGYPSKPYYCRA